MRSGNQEALANHERILALKHEATRNFILMGRALKESKEREHYKELGYPTFEAYLESPSLSIAKRSAYSLIAIYRTFVEELGYSASDLAAVDYSKLDRLLPLLSVQPVAHREWVEKAKTLPRRVLEEEVRSAAVLRGPSERLSKQATRRIRPHDLNGWVNTIQCGDCLELLAQLPSDSIDCCVTSPPYWQLRDYGAQGQVGLEPTFSEYVERLCTIFDEVRRVLKAEGTCWVVLGDTFSGSNCGRADSRAMDALGNLPRERYRGQRAGRTSLPNKCLVQIPSRFGIEMTNRGWILRNEIIWHKPNCLPASVKDRFTVDFERVFFFTKSPKYWFEMQFEPQKQSSLERLKKPWNGNNKRGYPGQSQHHLQNYFNKTDEEIARLPGRNKRSVWKIPTRSFKAAHFATFPPDLINTPIKAGCPENGIVLDPFCGSGTTAVVAAQLGRQFLGLEINPDYVQLARDRLRHHGFRQRPDRALSTKSLNQHKGEPS